MNSFRRTTARAVVASLLFTGTLPAFATGADDSDAAVRPECGFYCLAVGLRTFGVEGSGAAALRARLGDPGAEGYSLAELDRAATDLGAQTLAVETTLENLKARAAAGERFAAIAHVDENHFVLVSGFEPDGRVKVIDPPQSYLQPAETFTARWDGRALLLSPDSLARKRSWAGFRG